MIIIKTRCFKCGAELTNPKFILDELEFNSTDHRLVAVCNEECFIGSKNKLEELGWDTTLFTETYTELFITNGEKNESV